MMKKTLIVTAVLFFASIAAAQPVQLANTGSTDLDLDMAGGETESFSIDIETNNGFNEDFAVETRLKVSNYELDVPEGQDRVSGEEFSLERSLNKGEYEECSTFSGGKNYAEYICTFDSSDFEDENTVDYRLDSATNLMPGDYQFELNLLYGPSFAPAVDDAEVNLSEGELKEVSLGSTQGTVNVNINSAVNGTAELETHESVVLGTPNGEDEFISAVSVNINSTEEDTSEGTVRFEHDGDLTDIDVYLLDEGEWRSNGIEIVEAGDNFVLVEVPHFSTYAAYGEEPDSPGGGGSSTTNIDSQQEQNQAEDDNATDDSQSPDDQQTDNETQDQTGDNGEEGENQSEEGTETPEGEGSQQANSLTGQFADSPGSIGLIVALVLIVAIVGLDYTGRLDVEGKISELKSYFREDSEQDISFS